MGRIKTQQIKRMTFDLMGTHSDKFSKDYSENKKKVEVLAEIRSKKLKNMVSGYVTRLKKAERE